MALEEGYTTGSAPLGEATGGATGITGLLNGLHQATQEDTALRAELPELTATTSREQGGPDWNASPEVEAALMREVRALTAADGDARAAAADEFWVLACVRARKGDVARASARLRALVAWRAALNAELPEARAKSRALLLRGIVVSSDVVCAIALVIEWTLRTYPDSQRRGLIFLADAADAGFHNLDIRVPREMSHAFGKTLPVRVAGMYIMNLPWFIRPAFALISLLLSSKLKSRVRGFSRPEELGHFFETGSVPRDANMGGTLEWDLEKNKAWVDEVMLDCETWPPVSSLPKESPEE